MSRLPARPNLEHLKKQAKALLDDYERGDRAAVERFHSLIPLAPAAVPKLADAQHAIARDYGFSGWPELRKHVESLSHPQQPSDQLWAATCASDAQCVAQILGDHPELKTQLTGATPPETYVTQAFRAAVQRSDRHSMLTLLAAGADIRTKHRSWAGDVGMLDDCAPEIAPFLMERGAKLDIYSAARLGAFDVLEQIVATASETVNARGPAGQFPLHCASTIEIAAFLLDHGAQIDGLDLQHESTAAQHMLRVVQARHYPADRQAVARYLVSRGCDTDILMAAALGDLPLVRRHLEINPESIRTRVSEQHFPKQNPKSGGSIYIYLFGPNKTAHQIARDFGHEEIFQFLISSSPEDLKIAQACELGDEKLFRAQLAARPDFAVALSESEQRRLPDAAQSNNNSGVRMMLEAGWPADALGEYRMTALQWAAWHGNAEMVREILKHGPKLETSNEHKITAMGCSLHGSMNSWHRDTGDYAATVEALLAAGSKAPEITAHLEASHAAREVLLRHAQLA